MTKEKWLQHADETFGLVRPSMGGDRETWVSEHKKHLASGCEICKARKKTRKANAYRKQREQVMRDCGLVKVYGSVSGKVYWE